MLQKILSEFPFYGSLKGFKHFTVNIRGKEELILTLKTLPLKKFNSRSDQVIPASPNATETSKNSVSFLITAYVKYQTTQIFVIFVFIF